MAGTNADFYSMVQRRIWNDAGFRGLSKPPPNARDLFLYLLTTPHATQIPGLVAIGESAMAEDLGWPLAGLRKALAELEAVGMVKVDRVARLLWLPNGLRHNPPKSPDNVLGWTKHWRMLPECALLRAAAEDMMSAFLARGGKFAEHFARVSGSPMVTPTMGATTPPMVGGEHVPPPPHQKSYSYSQPKEEEDLPPAPAGGAAAPSAAPPVVVFSPTPGAAPQMSLLGEPDPPSGKPKKGKPREPTPHAPSTEVKGIWQTVWAEAGMSGPAPWGADAAAVAKRYLEAPGASPETARQAIVGMLRTQAGEWHRTHENGKHLGIPAALAGKNVVAFTNAGKAWLAAKEAAARPKRVPPPPDPIPEFARRLYEQDMARKAAEQAPEPETFPEAS